MYHQVKSFSFLVSLVTFDKILSFTKHASDQLQSPDLDLSSAADLVAATQSSLLDYRTDEMWHKLYTYVECIANHHCIEISSPLPHSVRRSRQPPKHLSSSVIFDSTGSRQPVTSIHVASDEYKIKFYFPVLDSFLAEISRHFDNKNLNIMIAIQLCHPTSKFFLVTDSLQPLVDAYDLPKDKIEIEASLAKRMLEGKELTSIGDVLLELKPLSSAFPNLSRLAMAIAVSTAQCERSFSTVKLVKGHLRSTMGDERLANMAILLIERKISAGINLEDVVTEFSGLDNNRRVTLIENYNYILLLYYRSPLHLSYHCNHLYNHYSVYYQLPRQS